MPTTHLRLRPDVECIEVQRDGETIFYYKNSLTADYYKFNELQHEMLKRLDGKHTIAEVCSEISALFEMDVPVSAGDRFVAQLSSLRILDDLTTIVTTDQDRKHFATSILRALRRDQLTTDAPEQPSENEPARSIGLALIGLAKRDLCSAAEWIDHAKEVAPRDPRVKRYFDGFWMGVSKAMNRRSQSTGESLDRRSMTGGSAGAHSRCW